MNKIIRISILSLLTICSTLLKQINLSSAFQFKFKASNNNKSPKTKSSSNIALSFQNNARKKINTFVTPRKHKSTTSIFLRSNDEKDTETKELKGGKMQLVSFVTLSFLALSAISYNDAQSPSSLSYSLSQLHQDQIAFLLTSILAIAFVKVCTYSSQRGWIQSKDSRKIIHTFSAPLYIFVWPLFSGSGRLFAALIPLTNALRLYTAGKGSGDEVELANAVSRSGDKEEALGGPFVYVIIMFLSTLLFWFDNLSGVLAMTIMAVGDGTADLVGRRLGKSNKWFFNKDKSIAGSLAFFIFSLVATVALSIWLDYTNTIPLVLEMNMLVPRLAIISLICTFVELIPFGNDNWTVPISAAILSQLLLS